MQITSKDWIFMATSWSMLGHPDPFATDQWNQDFGLRSGSCKGFVWSTGKSSSADKKNRVDLATTQILLSLLWQHNQSYARKHGIIYKYMYIYIFFFSQITLKTHRKFFFYLNGKEKIYISESEKQIKGSWRVFLNIYQCFSPWKRWKISLNPRAFGLL